MLTHWLPDVEGMFPLHRCDDESGSRAVFKRIETTKSVIGDRDSVDAVFAAFNWITYSSPALLSPVLSTQLKGVLSDIEVPEFKCHVQRREVSCNWKISLGRYFVEKNMAKEALEGKVEVYYLV